jgi:hypothetical protein
MNNLVIFTVAEGRYQHYADMWELALEKAYPEYERHLLTLDTNPKLPRYYGACIRFLFDHEKFSGKYLYITDIDMMIVRESPSLLDFHVKELEETGLSYSNTQRGSEVQGFNRLTGLHFITPDYWEPTFNIRAREYNKLCRGEIGNSPIDDELMLMRIVKDSGLPMVPPRRNLIERHHGLHLGTVRAHEHESHQKLRQSITMRVSREKAAQWQEVVCSSEYSKILEKIRKKDRQAYHEFYLMDQFTKSIANSQS